MDTSFIHNCEILRDKASSFVLSGSTTKDYLSYNPLEYAWEPFVNYLHKALFKKPKNKILLLGMNPGPFGMAQTGVPFGDISMVRDFIKITGKVKTPEIMHPKRLIEGFECTRSEVSGTRLWGWARDSFNSSDEFFKHYFVWNYCPLVFMDKGGANKTPDKLESIDRELIYEFCDEALLSLIKYMEPTHLIGVGKFARKRLEDVCKENNIENVIIGDILHPSPASPKANRGWSGEVIKSLKELGVPTAINN